VTEPIDPPAKLPDHFRDRILVDCPRCGGLAIVTLEEDLGTEHIGWATDRAHAPRRVVCTACALSRRQGRRAWARPAMGLPLRLFAESRHGALYAFNAAHLDYIESYVRDPLRREAVAPGGFRNRSIASRLPRWVKSAGNRDEVLKLIARMRARLAAD
jgi:hypothetical protein